MIKSIILTSQEEKIEKEDNIRISSAFNFSEDLSQTQLDFPHNVQVEMIDNIYNKISIEYDNHIIKDIKKKIMSYMNQDKLKQHYCSLNGITYDGVLEKLFLSRLKCYYCDCNIDVIYKYKRSPTQWTLDRIINEDGHTFKNVLVSCLKCNLSRRCKNSDKFLFTQKLNIIKA